MRGGVTCSGILSAGHVGGGSSGLCWWVAGSEGILGNGGLEARPVCCDEVM